MTFLERMEASFPPAENSGGGGGGAAPSALATWPSGVCVCVCVGDDVAFRTTGDVVVGGEVVGGGWRCSCTSCSFAGYSHHGGCRKCKLYVHEC